MDNFNYLMEHPEESKRLHIKSNREQTLQQLLSTGLANLPSQPTIVDAGCGGGFVSKIILEYMHSKYRKGRLILIDGSQERLNEAKAFLAFIDQDSSIAIDYLQADLSKITLPESSVDYIFSRFVFEYLPSPSQALTQFNKILKPGAIATVGDLDYNCLTHYPLQSNLEQQLHEITQVLQKAKLLDPYVGRKLYSYYVAENFKDINIQVIPHHLFYGTLPEADLYNWTAKIDQIIRLRGEGKISLSFDPAVFKDSFLKFLVSKERFSYTPLILVSGKKNG